VGQYLSTDQQIGYLVTDLELDPTRPSAQDLALKFSSSQRNIKTRIVF
jgi:hypothetical protein